MAQGLLETPPLLLCFSLAADESKHLVSMHSTRGSVEWLLRGNHLTRVLSCQRGTQLGCGINKYISKVVYNVSLT